LKTGAIIGLAFGLLWWLVGAGAMEGPTGTVLQILGIVLFVFIGIWIVKRKTRSESARPRWAYYVVAVIAEIAAITLAQAWLTVRGMGQLILPVVGVIVGLHFTGLWLAFARRRFLILAGAMTSVNLFVVFLPLAPGTRLMISGFGSSLSLLATALLP
jgi:hypothetical protein